MERKAFIIFYILIATEPTITDSALFPSSTTARTETQTSAFQTVKAPLEIHCSDTFIPELNNSSSQAFKDRAKHVEDKLENIYKWKFPSFIRAHVLSFRAGSVITTTNLIFNATENTPSIEEITNTLIIDQMPVSLDISPDYFLDYSDPIFVLPVITLVGSSNSSLCTSTTATSTTPTGSFTTTTSTTTGPTTSTTTEPTTSTTTGPTTSTTTEPTTSTTTEPTTSTTTGPTTSTTTEPTTSTTTGPTTSTTTEPTTSTTTGPTTSTTTGPTTSTTTEPTTSTTTGPTTSTTTGPTTSTTTGPTTSTTTGPTTSTTTGPTTSTTTGPTTSTTTGPTTSTTTGPTTSTTTGPTTSTTIGPTTSTTTGPTTSTTTGPTTSTTIGPTTSTTTGPTTSTTTGPTTSTTTGPTTPTTTEVPKATVKIPEIITDLEFHSSDTFTAALNNIESQEFKNRSKLVKDLLEAVYKPKYDNFLEVIVQGFRPGSIITITQLVFSFSQSLPSRKEIADTLLTAAETGNVNPLNIISQTISVNGSTFATTAAPSTAAAASSASQIESLLLQATGLIIMGKIFRLFL